MAIGILFPIFEIDVRLFDSANQMRFCFGSRHNVVQAMLRGDGASMTTPGAARDKAYTALMLGASRNEDSSAAVAKRMGPNASAGGLAKLPHILLAAGALVIRAGGEPIGAIGVGGAPGGDLDEACAKAGLDKIADRLK
jgi:uncharacterized protein GlcG (DUF336 family)